MDKCVNHHLRAATARCKSCMRPLCTECKMIVEQGTFCSPECIDKFRSFQSRVAGHTGSYSGFSFFAWIKHLAIAGALIAIIYGALYYWLGTGDPAEIWDRLLTQLRLAF